VALLRAPLQDGPNFPHNAIYLTTVSPCASGYSEVTALNGKTLWGTLTANGDAGGTGGNDNITPAGTNSAPAFTGSSGTVSAQTISWPAGVPAFTGTPFSSVINHTHTVTTTWNVQGGTTAATTGTHVMTSTATGGSARAPTTGDVVSATTANPGGGVASITPAGTVAWPAGVPTNGTVSFTPAGTVAAPAFTGTQFDNRSAFVKVIFCKKD
jgi:hypothetical protein